MRRRETRSFVFSINRNSLREMDYGNSIADGRNPHMAERHLLSDSKVFAASDARSLDDRYVPTQVRRGYAAARRPPVDLNRLAAGNRDRA